MKLKRNVAKDMFIKEINEMYNEPVLEIKRSSGQSSQVIGQKKEN